MGIGRRAEPRVGRLHQRLVRQGDLRLELRRDLGELRDAYASETDPAKQKAIAEQVQLRLLEYPTFAPLGQFTTPTAVRSNLSGVITPTPSLALWNIEKK